MCVVLPFRSGPAFCSLALKSKFMPTKHNYLDKYVRHLRFSDGCICQFSELALICMNDHKILAYKLSNSIKLFVCKQI